jgi:hypothetical protein
MRLQGAGGVFSQLPVTQKKLGSLNEPSFGHFVDEERRLAFLMADSYRQLACRPHSPFLSLSTHTHVEGPPRPQRLGKNDKKYCVPEEKKEEEEEEEAESRYEKVNAVLPPVENYRRGNIFLLESSRFCCCTRAISPAPGAPR